MGKKAEKVTKRRQYSDSDKATALAALDANGGNVAHTSRQIGVPRKTLAEWAAGRMQHPMVAEIRHEKKEALADRLEGVAHALLDNILQRAQSCHSPLVPLKDFATSFGIVVDKMQLLRGKPTAIVTDTARSTVARIVRETGLSEERARQIVALQFNVAESELISEEVM